MKERNKKNLSKRITFTKAIEIKHRNVFFFWIVFKFVAELMAKSLYETLKHTSIERRKHCTYSGTKNELK